jgi:THO complex subunit 1
MMLNDIFEGEPIATCRACWTMLEAHREELTTPTFVPVGRSTRSSLSLLRMCNELLRKLSKAHNTEFCGRVLSFLSYVFPLTERSAINVAGKYNEANITEFEEEEEFMAAEAADPDLSEKTNETTVDKGSKDDEAPVDYRLYKTLWGLQNYLSQPKLGVSTLAEWKQLIKNIASVLTAFEGCSFSSEDLTRARDKRRQATANQSSPQKAKLADPADQTVSHFFQPKYLSASRLLRLQRKDPEFRQQLLTQLLILFGYFESAQCKLPARCDIKELADSRKRILELLKRTPPDGAEFVKSASHIMAREANWKGWKAGKCQNFVRAPSKSEIKTETVQEKRKRLSASSMGSAKRSKTGGGAEVVKVLKSVTEQDNVTCLSSSDFVYTPGLDSFLEEFEEAEDPENCVEAEYHPKNNKMYCWRLRRLLTTNNLELFDHMEKGTVEKAVLEYVKSQGRGPKEEEKKKEVEEGEGEEKKEEGAKEGEQKEEAKKEEAGKEEEKK